MTIATIGIGTTGGDGTGDPIRTAFDKCNDNFVELYSREIVPASPYTVATVQAAFNTAVANCLAGTGPRRVSFYEDFIGNDGIFVGNSVTNAPANLRIKGLEIYFAPGVITRKTAADFNVGNANCLFQFVYCEGLTLIGGRHFGRVNDTYYEDTIVPFGGSTPNGASASGMPLTGFLFGDDGFRFFSCDDLIMRDMEFRNYGDSAWRITPITTDVEEAAGDFGVKRVRVQNCRVFNSLQTSTTNTSGTQISCPYEYTMVDCYSERINSNKWAHRGESKKSKGLRIINCTAQTTITGYEVDGYSQVLISGCSIRLPKTAGISWVSNDTVAAISTFMDTIRITDCFVEMASTTLYGVYIGPDAQGTDHIAPAVHFDVTIKDGVHASAVAVGLNGKFQGVQGRTMLDGFAGQFANQAVLRDSKNVHLAVSGSYARNDAQGRVFDVRRSTAAGLSNVGLSENVTLEFDGLTTLNCDRFLIADAVKNLTVTGLGGVRGNPASPCYFDTLNGCDDLKITDLDMRVTTLSSAFFLTTIRRGVISNSVIGADGATPVTIHSTCAGVEVLDSVKLMNGNAWAAGGDGRGVDNQQGFLMASAARSGVNVDVTITHGLGTDFTVPSNAQRSFELIRPDGARVPISSIARQGATTLRAALAYDIGTAGTAAGATTNAAGYAIGVTTVTLVSAGTGTIVAGNYVKFGSDPTPYLVTAGDADVSNGGTLTFAPGLKVAIPASATAIALALNTLVHHERPIFNLENGGTFNAAGYRPADNSTSLALLKRGAVAVA